MSSAATRAATKLPLNATTQALLEKLGNLMGDPGRDPDPGPTIRLTLACLQYPQASRISVNSWTTISHSTSHRLSMSPPTRTRLITCGVLLWNLDSVYGRGPGLDPFLYAFPSTGPSTAIKFQTGTNRNTGPGGPSSNGTPGGMIAQSSFDVPRIPGTNTAVIGDPRNDENLIVVQFHHAMLRFHNAVVDLLLAAAFAGDIFAEAKRIVTHHYQWAVVHDFLKRICGAAAVNDAMASVVAPPGSSFRMPVESPWPPIGSATV